MFSIGKIFGLQAGQFSTRSLLLQSHAVVIAAICGFALSCWNKHHLEGSICCSKTFIYLSAFIVPPKTCKLPIPNAPPYHQRCWLLNRMLITRWKVSLLFSLEDTASVISNKNIKFDSSDHRTLFHFETIHFKWALAHRTRRRFWTMFTYGFLFSW